jgi:hypothetical protein
LRQGKWCRSLTEAAFVRKEVVLKQRTTWTPVDRKGEQLNWQNIEPSKQYNKQLFN